MVSAPPTGAPATSALHVIPRASMRRAGSIPSAMATIQVPVETTQTPAIPAAR